MTTAGRVGFGVWLALAELVCLASGAGATPFSEAYPGYRWRTKETPHFSIHFHQGEEEVAQRTARIGEEIYGELTPFLDWQPRGKTQVVLVNNRDDFNAWSTTLPFRTMHFFMVPPPSSTDFDRADDWLRLTFFHEYTHILHLDTVDGVPKYLRYIFGSIISYGFFSPAWYLEGLAVYNESRFTGQGRIGGPLTEMMLRAAVLDLKLPALDQMEGRGSAWPWGATPYLFGGMFVDYLAATYGADKLAQLNHAYSRGAPYALNSRAIELFGKDFPDLWDEWRRSLQKKYLAQYQALAAEGLTVSEPLTQTGYAVTGPRFSPDGRWLAYSVRDADHSPAIKALDMRATGLKPEALIPGRNAYTLAWSPDGRRVYLSRIANPNSAVAEKFLRYYDLFAYEIKKEKKGRFVTKPRQLTRDARLIHVDAAADGTELAGAVEKMDRLDLVLLSPDGKDLRPLTASEPGARWDTPRFSPDGRQIAASVARGGNRDVVILDRQGRELVRVTRDPAADRDPCWSPDSRYVVFTSARTGIYNLYAFDTAERKLYRVTNVAGGAFQPEVSPDGRTLVFVNYSSAGYDLHRLPFDPGKWKPAAWEAAPGPEPLAQVAEAALAAAPAELKEHGYHPWRTLFPPRFWLFTYGLYEDISYLSFETMGADALNQHTYVISFLYGLPGEYSGGTALYQYDRVVGEFTAAYQQLPVYYHDILLAPRKSHTGGLGPEHLEVVGADYYEMEKVATAGISATPRIGRQALIAGLSYRWEERDPLGRLPDELTVAGGLRPEVFTWSGIEADLIYSTVGAGARRGTTVRSLGVEAGRSLALGYEYYRRSWGGELDREVLTVDYREYVPIPKLLHHVLAWRLHYGAAWGDERVIPSFRMGGGYNDAVLPEPGSRFFSLRGFGLNQFWGEQAAAGYLEYRLPLSWAENGWGMLPIYYYGAHLTLFTDAGMTWGGVLNQRLDNPAGLSAGELNVGVGAEVDYRMRLGYGLGSDTIFRLGYADDVQGQGLGGTLFLSLGVSF